MPNATSANDLRKMFIEYFKEREHAHVASSPIVPPDDPTMLFTSAGMVQFKPLYAGEVDPLPYTRATTVQKCLRAGGKGSDLENVGKTLRHHTFFEMLGNFSFGDYFKQEALEWGWDFILNKMKLPKDRLWGTIYEDDPEAGELLKDVIGLPPERIIPLDAKENFWGPAGDTGACGPCSEVCFFTGTDEELERAKKQDVVTIARRIVEEGDLFLEIWNMVFPQFDQQKDGSRKPLKNRGIDTGAGLERMTVALNFVETGGEIRTPYETDLLQPIVQKASQLIGIPYDTADAPEKDKDPRNRHTINAISDHARTLTFALSEGLVPSNEGRGYVLRRILRRALRLGYLLGKEEPFLYELVDPVVAVMGEAYPEITKQPDHVKKIIRMEEERFMRTVAQGTKILDEKIAEAKKTGQKSISGGDVFLLHATYGFPPDMTAEIADDEGLSFDRKGYEAAMAEHQAEARKSWKGGGDAGAAMDVADELADAGEKTTFTGYDYTATETRVVALVGPEGRVESASAGDDISIVLEATPFYAESGGQVADMGVIEADGIKIEITDVQKNTGGVFVHTGRVAEGSVKDGDTVTAAVDKAHRMNTMRNHTVTHILQAGLRKVLGDHITQSGSFVGPDGMRFDFSHPEAVKPEELAAVERFVNEQILADHKVLIEEMPLEEARERGAIAPFGEKYGHRVRVVQIGSADEIGAGPGVVSLEFCGGTHLSQIGRIGSFRLMAESSVAAGIRRIEGVTGMGAYEAWATARDIVQDLSRSLAIKDEQLAERVEAMQAERKKLRKELKDAKRSGGGAGQTVSVDSLIGEAKDIGSVKVVVKAVDGADPGSLRGLTDQIKDKVGQCVVLLGTESKGKAMLICGVTKGETSKVKAGDIIKEIAPIVGGGGGGRPDMAQAGGKDPSKLAEALKKGEEMIAEKLG